MVISTLYTVVSREHGLTAGIGVCCSAEFNRFNAQTNLYSSYIVEVVNVNILMSSSLAPHMQRDQSSSSALPAYA